MEISRAAYWNLAKEVCTVESDFSKRIDDEHVLVCVAQARAWLADATGHRVSVTWTREPSETFEAFLVRCEAQGRHVITRRHSAGRG